MSKDAIDKSELIIPLPGIGLNLLDLAAEFHNFQTGSPYVFDEKGFAQHFMIADPKTGSVVILERGEKDYQVVIPHRSEGTIPVIDPDNPSAFVTLEDIHLAKNVKEILEKRFK